MKALFKKEIQFYLNNPVGYIVVAVFAVFANFLFVKDVFVVGAASMKTFFDTMPLLLMIFIPAMTMRIISEEKRTNTIDLLLSLPVSETQIVLAKFLAILSMTLIGFVLTFGLPLSISLLSGATGSKLYMPEILIGYLGQLFVASGFIALSLYFSSVTKNQVVAFLLSVISIFFLIMFSNDFLASTFPKLIVDALGYLSPLTQADLFTKGVLDIRAIYYFVSFTVLFLFFTIFDLEKRR